MTFWKKNQVFIIGGLLAVVQVISTFISDVTAEVQWTAVGYAVLVTVLNYIARNWRGQTTTMITALITTLGIAGAQLELGSDIKWIPFALSMLAAFLVQYLGAVSADAKSRGYEASEIIQEAKKEGEEIQPASLTAKPK